jgi:hypothetical protein
MTIGAGGANLPARAFFRVFTVTQGLSPGGRLAAVCRRAK